jgi:hypothetical protein
MSRVRPPSKRMTATESETTGNSNSPRRASGSTQPKRGPTAIPVRSKSRIEGRFKRQAAHWAAMPRTAIRAKLGRKDSGGMGASFGGAP